MKEKPAHRKTTPQVVSGSDRQQIADKQRSLFLTMALDMTWQLALVVLLPIIVGVELDNVQDTGRLYTLVGLGVALVGTAVVLYKTLQKANQLPVPKLTDAQRKKIKKEYEAEDDE